MAEKVIDHLLNSADPAIRYKVRARLSGEDQRSALIQGLQMEIRTSSLVRGLLSERDAEGKIPYHPYTKWAGAHWVLACLADLGYPAGDKTLKPLLEQSYGWLLSDHHWKSIRTIHGQVRRCGSQEGNALYYACTLGLADDRSQELAERLMKWQWADGGWNCDKKPEAVNSSFMESLIPMRGLAVYACLSGDVRAARATKRTAEIFLKREMFKGQRDGEVISPDFVRLHYPCYWHYDILFGLKVMAEAGFIEDPRCRSALDLLEAKRLPDGGFPAEGKYYRVTDKKVGGSSRVNWGRTSTGHMNEFVTADALCVLKEAGRQ